MINNDSDKMRILHFLNEDINNIVKEIPLIAEQGFNAIQISPVQPFKNQDIENPEWYLVYQPLSFSIGNLYGNKEDLIYLCDVARKYDIRIIVDIVCEHTANQDDINCLIPNQKVDPTLLNNPYFWKQRKLIDNWEDRRQVTHYCMGMPGLDLANYDLQDIILKFLYELIDCGVGGFRFDAAKSIALPYPDDYIEGYPDCHFWSRVIKEGLANYDLFNYSEVIFASDELIKSYSKYTNVLTNRPIPEIPETVSVEESHDTYLNDNDMGWTRNKSIDEVIELYEVLTSKSNKTIFYNRPNTNMWKRDIVKDCNLINSSNFQKVKRKTSI